MANHSELPQTRATDPIEAPPESERPTTAMLKADIDSGRTGDKVEVYDPGLSPLGTDDEAAGRPPSAHRIRLARQYETMQRWAGGARKTGAAHIKSDGFPVAYVGFIGAVAAAILLGALAF